MLTTQPETQAENDTTTMKIQEHAHNEDFQQETKLSGDASAALIQVDDTTIEGLVQEVNNHAHDVNKSSITYHKHLTNVTDEWSHHSRLSKKLQNFL